MAQRHEEHVCGECGSATPRWMGRCPACGAWGTLAPVRTVVGNAGGTPGVDGAPIPVCAATMADAPAPERLVSGLAEFDRTLGGGLLPGSALLVGGEPGAGKSTLLLQVAERLAAAVPVLYASAEESLGQLVQRARRIGACAPNLRLLAETELGRIREAVARTAPRVLFVDSVQTVRDAEAPGAAGSVAQVRRVAGELVEAGHRDDRATVLVGHVTKDGTLAGPKLLEHLVDVVVYFEGDDRSAQRVVRCVKNRFGAVDELGVFEMTGAGLVDAQDLSTRLLAARVPGTAGAAVGCVREGRRTLLVEVQALAVPSSLAVPRRSVVGLDPARVAMIAAVLERWGGLPLGATDLFVAAVGGVRVNDPAADLAAAVAIASAQTGRAAPADAAWVGELGLCGDLRVVPAVEARAAEAARLGFRRCVVPAGREGAVRAKACRCGIEVERLARVGDVLGLLREG